MTVAVWVMFPRHQLTAVFVLNGAVQVTTIFVPVGVFAVTVGETVTAAEFIPMDDKIVLASAVAVSESPPMADATLQAS